MTEPKNPAARNLGSLLNFPEEPAYGFVTCPECQIDYTTLMESGKCFNCEEEERRRADQRRREAAAAAANSRDAVLRRAGAPRRLVELAFREPHRWPRVAGQGPGLDTWAGEPELVTLAGLSDTGKTCLASELLARWGDGAWVVAGDVPKIAIADDDRWNKLLVCQGLVVVDELGRGHEGNGWERVHRLVGGRWEEMLPTVLTTNMSFEALGSADTGHPALARRIGEGWWVPLTRPWRERVRRPRDDRR